jgi:hypothetical protein
MAHLKAELKVFLCSKFHIAEMLYSSAGTVATKTSSSQLVQLNISVAHES